MRVFLSRRIGRRNRIGVSLTPQEVLTAGKWYVITWAICIIIGVCLYLAYGETKTCISTWDSQMQVWRERCSDGSRETWRYDSQRDTWYGRQWQAPRDSGTDGKAEKREKGAR